MPDPVDYDASPEQYAEQLAAQQKYNQAGALATGGSEIEQRQWYLERCVQTLQEARKIRADAELMTEIRAFIRGRRDAITALLDEIG